jgi:DNA polymerase-3 subunit delta
MARQVGIMADELRERLEQGDIAPFYALVGDEFFVQNEALDLLRKHVLAGADPEAALMEFSPQRADVRLILDELRTKPFLGPRKLVLMREAESFLDKNAEVLGDAFKSARPVGVLVVTVRKLEGEKAGAKLVKKHACAVSCSRLYEDRVPGWATLRARKYGKRIAFPAAQRLVGAVGGELQRVDNELQKLAIYVGERPTIEAGDVEALVGADRARTVFELADAVGRKRLADALRIARHLLHEGDRPPTLISQIHRHFRRIMVAKQLLAEGMPDASVAGAIRMPPMFFTDFKRQVSLFAPQTIDRILQALLDADLASKTSGLDDEALIAILIAKLCT